jgi:hypothetical protein
MKNNLMKNNLMINNLMFLIKKCLIYQNKMIGMLFFKTLMIIKNLKQEIIS